MLNLKMKLAIAKQTVETDVTLATAAMKKQLLAEIAVPLQKKG